jgi:hypothetical protein
MTNLQTTPILGSFKVMGKVYTVLSRNYDEATGETRVIFTDEDGNQFTTGYFRKK